MSPVIQALLESLGVTLVAACGVALGWWFSNRRKPLWLIGYIAPFLLLILVSLPRRLPRLELVIPFRWIMAGRREFVVMALVCTTLLVTLLPKLSRRGERAMVGLFAAFATLYIAVLPFLMPALDYGRQSRLNTRFDDNGVCLQSNSYNCGPAAAVTALRRLGVPAEEGELAVRAHTSFVAGTSPDSLADAIRRLYGLPCCVAHFSSLDELRGKEPLVARVKHSMFMDHFVTVLAVREADVVIGDPFTGRSTLSHDEFARKWRKCAVVIEKGDEPSEQEGR